MRVQVRDKQLPPGIRLARLAKCLGIGQGSWTAAEEVAKEMYYDDGALLHVIKAAVAGGSGNSATWAGNLVGDTSSVYADFAEYLRPQTIVGKFGTGIYPRLTVIPFRTRLLGESVAAGAGWVGEGNGIVLTAGGYTATSLAPKKCAALSVLTRELVESSSPQAEILVRDALAKGCRQAMDVAFIKPGNPGVVNVRPASISNGISALHSSGTGSAAVRADARAMMAAFIAAKNPLNAGVWIMSATTALTLSCMETSSGDTAFPEIDPINGGRFFKLPVIVSETVTDVVDSGGQFITLVNAEDIYFASEGGMQIDVSREGAIEMSDAPTNSAATGTGAQMLSLFQTDSIAFRVVADVNWARRRNTGVALLDDVAYAVAA